MQKNPSQITISDFGWPMDDSMSQQHFDNNNNFYNILEETSGGSFLGSPSTQPNVNWNIDDLNNDGKDKMVSKKLDHNANERDRRKKINSLYDSLRSLIPDKRKLSIPATVSQVVKYIPLIQNEVERLVEKKEALSRKMCKQLENNHNNIIIQGKKEQNSETQKYFFVGTADRLGDREIVIQISTLKSLKCSFYEILLHLEQERLKLLNLSSFECSQGRVFHNLHLQVGHETQVMDLQNLRESLLSFYENRSFQC